MQSSYLLDPSCRLAAHSSLTKVTRWIRQSRIAAVAAPEKEIAEHMSYTKPSVPKGLNKFSSQVTQPKSQGASQAMLYATGLKEGDMDKPQV